MDQSVVHLNRFGDELVRSAFHVGTNAAGFFDQQLSGGHIPGTQSKFPVAVEPPAGDISEANGGRSTGADAGSGHRQLVVKVDVDVKVTPTAGKAGAHQAFVQLRSP